MTTTKQSKSTLTCTSTLTVSPFHDSTISKALQSLATTASSPSLESPAWKCDWSSDGSILASCHGAPHPCIRLWKQKTKQQPSKRKRTTATNDATTPSPQTTNSEEEEEEWYLYATLEISNEEGDETTASTIQRTIRSIAFAPKQHIRNVLAAASFDGSVYILEDFSQTNDTAPCTTNSTTKGWERTAQLEGHQNEVKDVKWNATGTLLASCGRDKTIWIWETFLPGSIYDTAEGDGDNDVNFECECLAVLEGHTQDVKSIVFAPSHGQWGDGDEILLSCSYDDSIKCWAEDAGDWYCAHTLSTGVHSSTIWTIAVSPGGIKMISGSADQSLAIWKCWTASEKQNHYNDPYSMLLEEEGTNNGNEDYDSVTSDRLWKCVGKVPWAHKIAVYSVDCAPSVAGHGRIASSGADNCINVYREIGSTANNETTQFILDTCAQNAHEGDVNCIQWHPRIGTKLASVGDDGLVKIWKYIDLS